MTTDKRPLPDLATAVAFLAVLWSSSAAGGELSPDLVAALDRLDPGDEIALLVDFEASGPPAAVQGATRGRSSERLVTSLRRRATAAEAPVRRFLEARGAPRVVSLWATGGLAVAVPAAAVPELAALPGVTEVRLDGSLRLHREQQAESAAVGWNLEMAGAPVLWARGITGAGAVVAILDSGVDHLHEDLGPRWRGGTGGWYDPYGEHAEPHDADGHGTRVAGLIVGGDATGSALGVAPGARWIAARVFDDAGEARFSAVHQAFQWALDPDADPATDDAPHVVAAPWGFAEQPGACVDEFAPDIGVLRAAGIAVVFSAGNAGPGAGSSLSPADNPGTFPVGGVDASAAVMAASSRGPSACDGGVFPSVVAPGDGVVTTDTTLAGLFPTATAAVGGTSFAAPHAAGVMALLLDAHPAASTAQLEAALRAGAGDLGTPGPDNDAGWGVLDAEAAEAALAGLLKGPGTVTTFTDEGAFLAAAAGRDTVLEGFEDDAAWGDARAPASRPSVASQGVTWASNHLQNTVTTGEGPARTGSWGFFSQPHGDQTLTDPNAFIVDGFRGTGVVPLTAVGGWFKGLPGSRIDLVLDGDETGRIELGSVGNLHAFYGVVVSGSFTTFEFRETEGTVEDQKYIFVDDVTLAVVGGTANRPPDGVIVQPAGDVTIATGESVFFEGFATDPDGDAVTVLWDFGDGTTSTQKTPGNHGYADAGSYAVTFTATDEHGLVDPTPDTRTITVTSGPAQVMTGVVAGVADVRGAAGSDWHTDLALHNASAADAQVELYFAPNGATVGAPVALTVGAGHTETLDDVVSTIFGASGSGAIFWRVLSGDADALLVSANTYNRVDDVRRYGQQVPGVAWDEVAPAGESIWVPALGGPYRTNLGFAVDGDCTAVTIRGRDRMGEQQVERTVDVEPYSWLQLNKLFRREFRGLIADPDTVAVADSLHRFEVIGIDGRVVAYTSIIDNITSDGSYMLGQRAGSAGSMPWLPGAAFVRGVNASQWRSDVMLFNLGAGAGEAVVSYLPSDVDNGGALDSRAIPLAAGEGSFEGNILRELFGLRPPEVGTLAVNAAEDLLWMRTYTEEPGPEGFITYGQAIPPFGAGGEVTTGTEGRIFGFTVDDRTRANLILQNTAADGGGTLQPVTVLVDVLDRSGAQLHQESYALRAGEYLQHNGFIVDYGIGAISGGALRVVLTDASPETSSGGVLAMVSEVNGAALDGTNDGRLIPAKVVVEAPP